MVLQQELLQAIQVVTGALIAGIVTILVILIKMAFKSFELFLASKIGEINVNRAKSFVQTVVRDLEQNGAFKYFNGAQKKQMAKIRLAQWIAENNLPYEPAFTDMLIEEAVQLVNEGLGVNKYLADMEIIEGEVVN